MTSEIVPLLLSIPVVLLVYGLFRLSGGRKASIVALLATTLLLNSVDVYLRHIFFVESAITPLVRTLKWSIVFIGIGAFMGALRKKTSSSLFILLGLWVWLGVRQAATGVIPEQVVVGLALFLTTYWIASSSDNRGFSFAASTIGLYLVATIALLLLVWESAFNTQGSSDYLGNLPVGQLHGLATHPNTFGFIMGFGTVVLFSQNRRGRGQNLLLFGLALGLLWSGSDAAIGGTVASVTLMAFAKSRLNPDSSALRLQRAILLIGSSLIGILTIAILSTRGLREFTTGRDRIWESFASAAAQSGLLGLGLPDYDDTRLFDDVARRFENPHNALLSVQLSGGLIGTALFVLFWLSVFVSIRKMNASYSKVLAIGLTSLIFIVGFVESNAFAGFSFTSMAYGFLVGSLAAEHRSHKSEDRSGAPPSEGDLSNGDGSHMLSNRPGEN